MNYIKIYKSIIKKAKKERHLDVFEIHHVVPRSWGGTDHPHNLVKLTPREHFLAHLLITKQFPKCIKMKRAFNLMYFKVASNSRKYDWSKRIYTYNISKLELQQVIESNPGISRAKISKIFGCDVSVINDRLNTYDIQYSKINIDKCRNFISENPQLTFHDIGRVFGVSSSTISRYNKRYNLGLPIYEQKNNDNFSSEHIESLIEEGLNNTEISNRLNISIDKVRVLLKHYSLSNINVRTHYNVYTQEIVNYINNNIVENKKEILEKFNIGRTKLEGIIKRNNLDVRIRSLVLSDVKLFINKINSPTIQDIADEFNFGWDKVSLFVKKHKLL